MNKSLIICLLSLLPLAVAISGNPTESPAPYEIVLVGEKVVFDRADKVSSDIVIRDLGRVRNILASAMYFGLSVVWDGKEYKRNRRGPWNGPEVLFPKAGMRLDVLLKDFPVPAQSLADGPHTLALKDAMAKSNTLTIFIENARNSE
jgi:hypothetical protein